ISEGGRLVDISDNGDTIGPLALDVQNDLLIKMGAAMRSVAAIIDCGIVVLPPSSLRSHPITNGMTGVTVGCASALTLGANDAPLIFDSSNTKVLAAVAKTDATPLLTAAPTATLIVPGS